MAAEAPKLKLDDGMVAGFTSAAGAPKLNPVDGFVAVALASASVIGAPKLKAVAGTVAGLASAASDAGAPPPKLKPGAGTGAGLASAEDLLGATGGDAADATAGGGFTLSFVLMPTFPPAIAAARASRTAQSAAMAEAPSTFWEKETPQRQDKEKFRRGYNLRPEPSNRKFKQECLAV